MSRTVYWLYPIAFRDCRVHNFCNNLSRNSCICITLYMSLMQQLYITGALKGHHLKGVYLPQDLYFPLTTLLAHPRWDLPVKCFTPMVSENKSTLNKRMKSSLLGYYSSRYLLFILYDIVSEFCWVWVYKIMGLNFREMTSLQKSKNLAYHFNHFQK